MDKRFLAVLAVIIIVLAGIFVATQKSSSDDSSGGSNGQPTSHTEGQGQKGVKLVEYGDYECPICYVYYPVVKQVADKYSKDIYFQFRNLPLTEIHKNAFAAARAAEAAGKQGKYWQMHDKLYENQDPNGQSGWVASNSPLTYFDQYAQQLGLNVSQFDKDYASNQVNNAINADVAAFNKTNQPKATPTFFLDGKVLNNTKLSDPKTGQPSVDKFSQVINAEIAKKNPAKNQ